MFCSNCGTPISAGGRFCASCGTSVPVPLSEVTSDPPGLDATWSEATTATPMPVHAPAPRLSASPSTTGRPETAPKTSGLAIAGFICAFLCGILGLILSIAALNDIRNSQGKLTGDGLAIGGIILSIIGMLLGVIVALAG